MTMLFNPPVGELLSRDWKRMGYWRLVIGKDERNRRYKELRSLGLSRDVVLKGRDLKTKQYEFLVQRSKVTNPKYKLGDIIKIKGHSYTVVGVRHE